MITCSLHHGPHARVTHLSMLESSDRYKVANPKTSDWKLETSLYYQWFESLIFLEESPLVRSFPSNLSNLCPQVWNPSHLHESTPLKNGGLLRIFFRGHVNFRGDYILPIGHPIVQTNISRVWQRISAFKQEEVTFAIWKKKRSNEPSSLDPSYNPLISQQYCAPPPYL